MRQREVRVGDARRGQRADGEVEPVGHVPAFAKRIGDRPDQYEADRGSRDDGEVFFLDGVPDRTEEARDHGREGQRGEYPRMALWAVVLLVAFWVIVFFMQRAIGPSLEESKASGGGEGASQVKVACWNHYYPAEGEAPDYLAAPRHCLWYKRGAVTLFDGAVRGKKLEWEWGKQRATAEGRVKVEGVGDEFGEGRTRLLKPVVSCDRTVFSKIRYKVRSPEGRREGEYPIYTCGTRPN